MGSLASNTVHQGGGAGWVCTDLPAAVEPPSRALERDECVAQVTGVILVGTQPWGACALERVVPRALAPIANQPLLTHVLSRLADAGIQSANICGNTYTDPVRRRLGNGLAKAYVPNGLTIDYYEDLAPRGPAGCLRDAGLGSGCETVVAVDGSLIPQVNITDLVHFHRREGAALTVVVSRNPRANGNGNVAGSLSPMGVYVLSRSALEQVSPLGYQDIKEALIPHLYKRGLPVVPFISNCAAPRVTDVDTYMGVNGWVLRTLHCRQDDLRRYQREGYRNSDEVGVHYSASIDPTARLIGPVLIGKGTTVGRGVTIVGPTSIGAHCGIGQGAVLCRSSVWDECDVGPGAVLDRCVVTSGARVGAGTLNHYVMFGQQRSQFRGWRCWFSHPNGSR